MEQKINGLSLDLLSHPSDTIYEMMVASRFTPLMLAESLRIEYKELDYFMKGNGLLSELYYPRLAATFKVNESFIKNLFTIYKRNIELTLKNEGVSLFEFELVNNFNLRKFRKRLDCYAYVNNLASVNRIFWFRNYFKVKTLDVFKGLVTNNVAFRSNNTKEDLMLEKVFLASTLIKKEKEAVKANKTIDKALFTELKNITFEKCLDDVVYKVKILLKEYGINFIYFEHDENLNIQGFVTRSDDAIYLGVSNKGKYHDIFWFTLCHELGHLFYGILTSDYAIFDDEEKMADSFAEKVLIDQNSYNEFVRKNVFTGETILAFSESINVAPGIVVGRLQKDKLIRYDSFNYLRKKA